MVPHQTSHSECGVGRIRPMVWRRGNPTDWKLALLPLRSSDQPHLFHVPSPVASSISSTRVFELHMYGPNHLLLNCEYTLQDATYFGWTITSSTARLQGHLELPTSITAPLDNAQEVWITSLSFDRTVLLTVLTFLIFVRSSISPPVQHQRFRSPTSGPSSTTDRLHRSHPPKIPLNTRCNAPA